MADANSWMAPFRIVESYLRSNCLGLKLIVAFSARFPAKPFAAGLVTSAADQTISGEK